MASHSFPPLTPADLFAGIGAPRTGTPGAPKDAPGAFLLLMAERMNTDLASRLGNDRNDRDDRNSRDDDRFGLGSFGAPDRDAWRSDSNSDSKALYDTFVTASHHSTLAALGGNNGEGAKMVRDWLSKGQNSPSDPTVSSQKSGPTINDLWRSANLANPKFM